MRLRLRLCEKSAGGGDVEARMIGLAGSVPEAAAAAQVVEGAVLGVDAGVGADDGVGVVAVVAVVAVLTGHYWHSPAACRWPGWVRSRWIRRREAR